ncbi:hypothetical protein GQ457_11G029730 [Hibiscus cannabinus]
MKETHPALEGNRTWIQWMKHYMMERGLKYRAYANLRENKLRMKFEMLQEWEEIQLKQLEFTSNPEIFVKSSSVLMQPVPDFSSTLLKENRNLSVTVGLNRRHLERQIIGRK